MAISRRALCRCCPSVDGDYGLALNQSDQMIHVVHVSSVPRTPLPPLTTLLTALSARAHTPNCHVQRDTVYLGRFDSEWIRMLIAIQVFDWVGIWGQPCYRWVPLYPIIQIPTQLEVQWKSQEDLSSVFICLLHLKFAWIKRFLLGITFLELSRGAAMLSCAGNKTCQNLFARDGTVCWKWGCLYLHAATTILLGRFSAPDFLLWFWRSSVLRKF